MNGILLSLLSIISIAVESGLQFFDTAHPIVLGAAALAAAKIAEHFRSSDADRGPARAVAAAFMVGYAAHWFSEVDFEDDVHASLVALGRVLAAGALVYFIVALPFVTTNHALRKRVSQWWIEHKVRREHARRRREERVRQQRFERELRNRPQPEPPLSHEESLMRQSKQARLDYESEVRVVEASALDAVEKRRALNLAKQKYLRRLGGVLQ